LPKPPRDGFFVGHRNAVRPASDAMVARALGGGQCTARDRGGATIDRESFVGARVLLFNLPGASPPIFNQRSYFLFLCARSHQVAPTGVILSWT
jgi:hypothetical protein